MFGVQAVGAGCVGQGVFEAPRVLHGWCLCCTGYEGPTHVGHAGSGELCEAVSVYVAQVCGG